MIPNDVLMRMERGRKEMIKDAAKRRLCQRFEKGDTYWYINEKGYLSSQDTVTRVGGGGKPPHRIRNSYNFIRPMIAAKVSNATQNIPSYEVIPSTTDPEDVGAARMSEKVALYGFDKWRVRKAAVKACRLAIGGGGDAFALPYFDPNVGPYREIFDPETGEVEMVGEGEVKILVASGNEVYWEAGCDFYESRWWAIERAQPIDIVQDRPGFLGVRLTPDATTSDIPTDRPHSDNLVMVTEYFERPSPKNPEGRYVVVANKQVICPIDAYPLRGPDGKPIDEPVLHRLSYTLDPETDRDLGLTWQLIDPQRTVQDCWNKLLEWKNRTLNPQMKAPVGSLISPPDDTPGAVRYYRPIGDREPEWEQAPPVPEALFRILETMKRDMREIAGDEQIDAGPDVAAKTVQTVLEQSQARWAYFLGDLAEWHSRLMRHCLTLVQLHYTEPRLLAIKGRLGPELVSDFEGAHLLGQVDVRVSPGSLVVHSQRQRTETALAYGDRGWISPDEAMAMVDGGNAESLGRSYELDVARANRIISKIRDSSVMSIPPRQETDPLTGLPLEVPGWMPREFDNIPIWKKVISDWMKTEDFDRLEPGLQEVGVLIYKGLMQLEAQEQARMMAAQTAMAEQQGMNNASREQGAKPSPDQPKPEL